MKYATWTRLLALALLLVGCTRSTEKPAASVTLATTTSTRDSGLLDALLPIFQAESHIEVKVIAVGTGQALELGRRGDADVLLTHAANAEQQFMQEGYGQARHPVMYNDFVLVGPVANPAQVEKQQEIAAAFHQLAASNSAFVSRGDNSGTHMKEQAIWKGSDATPDGDWYIRSGTGMAESLRIASEKQAYTLTDRSTFLAQQEHLDLAVLVEGDPLLHNPYAVMVVNSEKHPHINVMGAQAFAVFLLAPAAREIIARHGNDKYGQPLFFLSHVESAP